MTTTPSANWNPAQYEKFKAQRTKPFEDLLALVRPGRIEAAADLGCGTGELTRRLFDQLRPTRLVGLDNSREMLAKSKPFEAPGLEFRLGDAGAFKPDGPLDLIFSNAALHWLPDHSSLFPKLLAMLSATGQLAVQMPCNFDHPSHRIAREIAARVAPALFAASPEVSGVLSLERYAALFFDAGFTDQICRIEVYGHPMPSGRDVVEWTRGSLLTAYESRLGAADFARFLDLYREALLAEIGDGPYFYAFKRLLLWARRG